MTTPLKERLVQLEVLRYNPDTDTEAHFQRYEVVCQEEWVVLDALNKVKADIELQPLSAINKVFERLAKGEVPSRVVLDFSAAPVGKKG